MTTATAPRWRSRAGDRSSRRRTTRSTSLRTCQSPRDGGGVQQLSEHDSIRTHDPRVRSARTGWQLNAVRTFKSPSELRREIIAARLWAGLHYHFAGVAGVVLGKHVAKY